MVCSNCGSERPDTDTFCGRCGSTLFDATGDSEEPGEAGWEYKELVIPLNVTSRQINDAQYTERIVLEHVRRAEEAGWYADTPTDWDQLVKGGHLKRTFHRSRLGGTYYAYESVTVRLKRPVHS